MKPVYYSEYLQLDKILNAQEEESKKNGVRADDEMLFIVIHQSYELWFKQILHEVGIVREIFLKQQVEDNSSDMHIVVHRLRRVVKILEMLVNKLGILETMTPLDFLDFRDFLRPASGFQSIQFKIMEALLGLPFDKRFGQQYYLSQLNPLDVDRVKQAEQQVSLLNLVNEWLQRMPFLKAGTYWEHEDSFFDVYRSAYAASLQDGEKQNLQSFDRVFMQRDTYDTGRRLSLTSNRAALFIMLYRDYPLLNAPYQFINALLDIDELLAQWRYRHMNMVQRMIGRRIGTGGSTGADYLKAAADTHYVFKEFADLTSFLIQRRLLPELPAKLEAMLKYTT
ncbi:MAG: tryptophan 2,3-dioxygenase [Chitinophagaceae bacterium]|nr:tryptophan 2,3-dioxygenase [Chitinophagaceae bacterium]